MEEGYHSSNPYHNAVHAADVAQAMHCYLKERKVFINDHSAPTVIIWTEMFSLYCQIVLSPYFGGGREGECKSRFVKFLLFFFACHLKH